MRKKKEQERERRSRVQPELSRPLGKLIAKTRRKKDFTQKQLAYACSMRGCPLTVSSIARIENGTRDISFYEFEVIDSLIHVRKLEELEKLLCDYMNHQMVLHR